MFVGILLLWHPVEGAISLTLVLIAFFIAEGIFQIVASLAIARRSLTPGAGCSQAASPTWSWLAVDHLGMAWDRSWALGLIVGVNLISSGIAIIMVAVTGRHLVRTAEKALRVILFKST